MSNYNNLKNTIIKYHHLFFILILSINYLFPLLIFGKVTLFYHDTLDVGIVVNKVLGEIYAGNLEIVKNLLNGEMEIKYLRRLFHPYSFFYYFFNTEFAYWLTDILVKIVAYVSFYKLVSKLNIQYLNLKISQMFQQQHLLYIQEFVSMSFLLL